MQGNRGIPETGAPTGRLVRETIGTFQLSPPCSRVQLHELAQVKPAVEQPGPPTNQGKKKSLVLSHFSLGEFVMPLRLTVALTFGSGTNCLMSLSLSFLINTYFIGLWWTLNVSHLAQSVCWVAAAIAICHHTLCKEVHSTHLSFYGEKFIGGKKFSFKTKIRPPLTNY